MSFCDNTKYCDWAVNGPPKIDKYKIRKMVTSNLLPANNIKNVYEKKFIYSFEVLYTLLIISR